MYATRTRLRERVRERRRAVRTVQEREEEWPAKPCTKWRRDSRELEREREETPRGCRLGAKRDARDDREGVLRAPGGGTTEEGGSTGEGGAQWRRRMGRGE